MGSPKASCHGAHAPSVRRRSSPPQWHRRHTTVPGPLLLAHCDRKANGKPKGKGHVVHNRWVTLGDPEPPGPCVALPTLFVVVSTLQLFTVLGLTVTVEHCRCQRRRDAEGR